MAEWDKDHIARSTFVRVGAMEACLFSQEPQVVGNVARAASVVPFHTRHQKRHIQNVQLIRQDVIAKAILKRH